VAFTIPDKGEGDSNIQSMLFQEDIEVLVAGLAGIDCVLDGLAVTGGADMTPAVAKGCVLSNRTLFAIAGADVTITTADATNPRIDLIVVNSSGALAVRAGTPAAAPKPPARTANDVVIAQVYVAANDTTIGSGSIVDRRVFPQSPVAIYRNTALTTTNTTNAAIEVLNKGASGLSVPDGLLATAGRRLRVRLAGNMLLNSGTPTVRLEILYGGTTFFSDISGAATADTDRSVWFIDFALVSTGSAAQVIVGQTLLGIIAAKTAPTTGLGDVWSTAQNHGAIYNTGTVNADNANRVLSVRITFSVSNSANELVVADALVELVL